MKYINHGVIMQIEGLWLSISEYSQLKDISVSTVRRYIKSDRVRHKKKDGKYIIFISQENFNKHQNKNSDNGELLAAKLKITELEMSIKSLRLENDELKMLVDLYEGQKNYNELPELPVNL